MPTTDDGFDYYLEIPVELGNLSASDEVTIATDLMNFTKRMSFWIENGFNENEVIEFQQIWANVVTLNVQSIQQLARKQSAAVSLAIGRKDSLQLTADIKASEDVCGMFFIALSDHESTQTVCVKLRLHKYQTRR